MPDRTFLSWPFFEDRHRQLAVALEDWCAAYLPADHADVDTACRWLVGKLGDGGLPETEDLRSLGETSAAISATERRAMKAERETNDRLIAHFLADRIGASFEGRIAGNRYAGTAYLNSQFCGGISYAVSGPVENGFKRVVMTGEAPIRDKSTCAVTGWRTDRLVFDFVSRQ